MIVVMKPAATEEHVQAIIDRVVEEGCKTNVIVGADQTVIGVIGDGTSIDIRSIGRMIGVENVIPISKPYKGASRQFKPEDTIIQVGNVTIGGKDLVAVGRDLGPFLDIDLVRVSGLESSPRLDDHLDALGAPVVGPAHGAGDGQAASGVPEAVGFLVAHLSVFHAKRQRTILE